VGHHPEPRTHPCTSIVAVGHGYPIRPAGNRDPPEGVEPGMRSALVRGVPVSVSIAVGFALAGCGDPVARSSEGPPSSSDSPSTSVTSPVSAAPTTLATVVPTVPPSTVTPTAAPTTISDWVPGEPGRLRVTQVLDQSGGIYMEGSISYLVVRDPRGTVVFEREFALEDLVFPVLDTPLPSGTYQVESYQRPCDGNCDHLEDPTDRCVSDVEVIAGGEVFVTASFAPALRCAVEVTAATPVSWIPDAYALATGFVDCGYSAPYNDPSNDHGEQGECLAAANEDGIAAELRSFEPLADTYGQSELWIIRSNADRSVDVWLFGNQADGIPWMTFHCAALERDPQAVFDLVSCGERVRASPEMGPPG
jgi:hypothetical protein